MQSHANKRLENSRAPKAQTENCGSNKLTSAGLALPGSIASQSQVPDTIRPTTIEPMPVAKLRPHPGNARTHSKKQIRQIADSIREFGFNNPVLIGEDGGIIAGHGRVEAAKLLGLDSVPTGAREYRAAAGDSMGWACGLRPRRAVLRHCLLVRGLVRRAPPSAVEKPSPPACLDCGGPLSLAGCTFLIAINCNGSAGGYRTNPSGAKTSGWQCHPRARDRRHR
jgi:ParB-like nuclease domain